MLRRWFTFGLTPEEEERFRRASLPADVARARVTVLLVAVGTAAFAWNDWQFFGPSGRLLLLGSLRLGLLVASLLLLRFLRRAHDPRAYDRAELAWALLFTGFLLGVAATRPRAFLAHVVVAVIAAFVTCFVLSNRYPRQAALSAAILAGEALVALPGLRESPQALLTAAVGLAGTGAIAIAGGWQLHLHRRLEFLAREELRRARCSLGSRTARTRMAVTYR